ncbi:MAG: right-handed parallel beta-helix repeat-containing protein [Candidatus Thorarchaeota archaeon]
MRKWLVVSLTLFILMGYSSIGMKGSIDTEALIQIADDVLPVPSLHDPIYIIGNDEFLQVAEDEGWPGTGTALSPIIIEGLRFRDGYHIFTVTDTDLHFEFRYNDLDGIDDSWCVIVLTDVRNAVIHKNTVRAGAVGVHMISTNDTVISDNHMYGQSWDAIFMEAGCYRNEIVDNNFHDMMEAGIWAWNNCSQNVIANNMISNVWYGASFKYYCPDNLMFNNTVRNALISGIYSASELNEIVSNTIYGGKNDGVLILSTQNTLEDNLIHTNGGYGIHLMGGSDETQVIGNVVINNTDGGIIIRSSESNTVEANDFLECGIPQVIDNGEGNEFRQNYYHEWIGEDVNNDGIIDCSYNVSGYGLSIDSEPMVSPNCVLPTWYDFTIVNRPSTTTSDTYTTSPIQSSQTTSTSSTSSTTSASITSSTSTERSSTTPTTSQPDDMTGSIVVLGTLAIAIPVLLLLVRKRVSI